MSIVVPKNTPVGSRRQYIFNRIKELMGAYKKEPVTWQIANAINNLAEHKGFQELMRLTEEALQERNLDPMLTSEQRENIASSLILLKTIKDVMEESMRIGYLSSEGLDKLVK